MHLDHAGATGVLLRDWPGTEVWVHERGAEHIVDPSRLVASATRLYGDEMDRLWGEMAPVDRDRLVVLEGGEERDGFAVAYTPGHASHHVSYLHLDSGLALTGDVTGVRIGDGPVIPPTPPPDIDLGAWSRSVEIVRRWRPDALAITHHGTYSDVERHLDELDEGLIRWGELARRGDPEAFVAQMEAATAGHGPYRLAGGTDQLYAGIARYWRKRDEQVSSPR
jgi:glyoxylase-like metal-dependent hydrolase (beta-lactamase superfamily II)